ncbi:hypothetical protein [Methanoregula sp.]|uniref:rolling circle replication-associated protein n=1 Tax=Methanoregula sp. TaxID=2052170 RepID=UPI0035628EC2
MSPATLGYPLRDIKLLLLKGKKNTIDLYPYIKTGEWKISDIVRDIKPGCEIPKDPLYWRVYRRITRLAKLEYIKLEKRERVDWDKTQESRLDEIEASVHAIFRAAVKPALPIVSGGTSPTEPDLSISTVKVKEQSFYVVPTGNLIYLFSQVQNSNTRSGSANLTPEKKGSYWDKLYKIPQSCSSERVNAIKILMSLHGERYQEASGRMADRLFKRDVTCPTCGKRGEYISGKKMATCSCGASWKPPLNIELKNELTEVQSTFEIWEDKALNKELFFDRGPGTPICKLKASTRFTDKGRKVKNIRTYDRGWSRANQLYKRGVFLTLTTDPAMHDSVWHANRHLAKAWNKYLSLLLSRKKQAKKSGHDTEKEEHDSIDNGLGRLKFIAAYEFMENGLIHLHVCIFGIRYLAKIDKIAEDWNKCGQGEIVHAYGIRKNGDVWEWNRESPADAQGKNPVDYLRKYLEKALYVNENFGLYWAMNKRFCSMSRIFQTKECQGCRAVWGSHLRVCPDCGAPLRRISQGFRFLGALDKGVGPTAEIMERRKHPMKERWGGVPA